MTRYFYPSLLDGSCGSARRAGMLNIAGVIAPLLVVNGFRLPGRPQCPVCGTVHPVWPAQRHYPPLGDMEPDPYAAGIVVRTLSAAGHGSPQCNGPLLRSVAEAYPTIFAQLNLSDRKRRKMWEARRDGKTAALTHETAFYLFNLLTFAFAMEVSRITKADFVPLLTEQIIVPANSMIRDVPYEAMKCAEGIIHTALAAPFNDPEGMFQAIYRAGMEIEPLSRQMSLDPVTAQHGMLMTAASYTIYAAALLTRSDSSVNRLQH